MDDLKGKLLAACRARTERITIDGTDVMIRELGVDEFSRYGETASKDRMAAVSALLKACVVDEKGEPCLSDEEVAVVASTSRMCIPIVNAIMRLSGMDKEDKKEKES